MLLAALLPSPVSPGALEYLPAADSNVHARSLVGHTAAQTTTHACSLAHEWLQPRHTNEEDDAWNLLNKYRSCTGPVLTELPPGPEVAQGNSEHT